MRQDDRGGAFGAMSDRRHGNDPNTPPAPPLANTGILLQWFSQAEIENLLGRWMVQADVDRYARACRSVSTAGLVAFKAQQWREWHTAPPDAGAGSGTTDVGAHSPDVGARAWHDV